MNTYIIKNKTEWDTHYRTWGYHQDAVQRIKMRRRREMFLYGSPYDPWYNPHYPGF